MATPKKNYLVLVKIIPGGNPTTYAFPTKKGRNGFISGIRKRGLSFIFTQEKS